MIGWDASLPVKWRFLAEILREKHAMKGLIELPPLRSQIKTGEVPKTPPVLSYESRYLKSGHEQETFTSLLFKASVNDL